MKRARIGLIATAVLAVSTMAFAQKPDFSGTWTPDAPAAAPAGGGGATAGGGGGAMAGGGGGGRMGGMNGPMTVKQTADALTIERQGPNGAITTTYKLDGSEFDVPAGRGGTAKATAKWDGSKLVISQKSEQGESTQTWSLTGGTLTIERTGGRGPQTTTFKKTT